MMAIKATAHGIGGRSYGAGRTLLMDAATTKLRCGSYLPRNPCANDVDAAKGN